MTGFGVGRFGPDAPLDLFDAMDPRPFVTFDYESTAFRLQNAGMSSRRTLAVSRFG